MSEKTLIFLTNPEPGLFILNINDENGHRKVTVSEDQLKGLARDSVNFLTRNDQCQR